MPTESPRDHTSGKPLSKPSTYGVIFRLVDRRHPLQELLRRDRVLEMRTSQPVCAASKQRFPEREMIRLVTQRAKLSREATGETPDERLDLALSFGHSESADVLIREVISLSHITRYRLQIGTPAIRQLTRG